MVPELITGIEGWREKWEAKGSDTLWQTSVFTRWRFPRFTLCSSN